MILHPVIFGVFMGSRPLCVAVSLSPAHRLVYEEPVGLRPCLPQPDDVSHSLVGRYRHIDAANSAKSAFAQSIFHERP